MTVNRQTYRLTSGGAEILIGIYAGTAEILHWGASLGDEPEASARQAAFPYSESRFDLDAVKPFGLWRENARGHLGRPALVAHRSGRDFSPLFSLTAVEQTATSLSFHSSDSLAGIDVHATFEALGFGLFRVGYTVENRGEDPLWVNDFDIFLPVPDRACESMDFTGRWAKERQAQRRDIQFGSWWREGREGRPGFDHTIVQLAMTKGATFQNGEIWSVGLEYSGNPRYGIEMQTTGRKSLAAGTVLLPGEVVLQNGESYSSPSIIAGYSDDGLDGVSAAHHEWLRSRPHHPTARRPRPLTLNVWEAVYFDHNFDKLSELAEIAASVGVERLVLDDGWFGARRDDKAGLGDWIVSSDVWPDGLGPLVDKVNSLGMEFGLWFEGEMVNPDSDLYRNHPDWILQVSDRVPVPGRNQQVLDFTNVDAFNYVLESISKVLSSYNISYIKWDHNRVLIDPGHADKPAVVSQAAAIYRMFDELKTRFPGLEIESCSSGGARIDLGMAHHADRFWTSDSNEALERQTIQRYTQMAIPPEMLGTHIGPTVSHQTGRVHSLNFRAITALFGHAGIEWDITETTEAERELLRTWAAYYKANRELFHSGRVTRIDQPDPTVWVYGVVSQDQSSARFAVVSMGTYPGSRPPRFTVAGLDPEATYRVIAAFPAGQPELSQNAFSPEWLTDGAIATGQFLERVGLMAPVLAPESGFVVECEVV